MARGYERHYERHHGLSMFGKDLVRRCGAHCELCDAQGVSLKVYEVPPVGSEADFEHCIMVCDSCLKQIRRPGRRDPHHWRCLNTAVWSPVPAARVLAIALLESFVGREHWALQLREQLYLTPDEQAWIDSIEL
ncbi:phnA protein [Marinobacterium aestuariivivens]|uniref:PhnA protein n=1 Tax=Marinobacterium aestuariivivens TaxID=1698799 RepID=A0ABW1ZV64_9GAMM